jgi:hypothetical protein
MEVYWSRNVTKAAGPTRVMDVVTSTSNLGDDGLAVRATVGGHEATLDVAGGVLAVVGIDSSAGRRVTSVRAVPHGRRPAGPTRSRTRRPCDHGV